MKWIGDDLANLLDENIPTKDLVVIYPHIKNIKDIRSVYLGRYRKGEIQMPKRQEAYDGNPELERARAEARQKQVKRIAPTLGEIATLSFPKEHLPYHIKLQTALEERGLVTKARFSDYQMGYKDAEGEAQIQDLHAVRFEVAFDSEPQWPLISRVESIKLPKQERRGADKNRKDKRAVILPDLQIPYQDENALRVALEITRDVKPDTIVILGDLLDLAAYSKYIQEPEWAGNVQEAINRTHQLLGTLRQLSPTAEIVVLEGNHDARLPKDMKVNSAKSLRLKRADQLDSWPVMSVPYLCAFDQFDIEYLSGYPANRYWLNDNLQVRHGHLVRSRSSTARAVNDDERASTIFGHVHRLETQYKTHHTFEGGKTNAAWGIGALCKIDGSVPSVKGGIDLNGNPVTNYEDWQQAVCVVDYSEGDGPFHVQPIYINTFNNYEARYNGKTYSVNE